MDPASLSLGLLPLVAGTIKAYGGLKSKLEVFRHYSRELRRMRQKLDLERQLFLNETRILVLTAVDDRSTVTCMLEDPNHNDWHSAAVDAAFREVLEYSYQEYAETIESISESIEEIQIEFECFKLFEAEQQEGEKLKNTIYRVRDRVKITWNKTKLEELFEELHESNGDLQRLGEQMRRIKKISTGIAIVNISKSQLPQECADFGMVRRASTAFYNALANAWSYPADGCDRWTSSRHDVRFFLDTKVLDSVSMDLLVVCPGHLKRGLSAPQPLTLHVRSRVTPVSSQASAENSQARRRRVRFQDSGAVKDGEKTNTEASPAHQSQQDSSDKPKILNLLNRNLCSFLQQTPGYTCNTCIGYLESCCDETFRHSIYTFLPGTHNLQKVVSIDQMLEVAAEKSVSIVDQLKLARSLVAAVLKFHSTPWLSQYLTLRDISLFQSSNDFSKCLPTLHFDTSFIDSRFDEAMAGAPEVGTDQEETTSTMARATEDAKLDHGIRNMTLWCLGVILLQIGHWSRLAEPDNVRAVRRLSYQVPDIGPRYQQLARRCLECDFGYGEDLTRPRLQQAVYEKAYCELASMIEIMDISEDELH